MDAFLSTKDKDNLSNYVRPETLEPCFKQLGKKDAQPHFNRPTFNEIRTLAQLIGLEGSSLGLLVGVDGRKARRWQGNTNDGPSYSQWTMICVQAAKCIGKSR